MMTMDISIRVSMLKAVMQSHIFYSIANPEGVWSDHYIYFYKCDSQVSVQGVEHCNSQAAERQNLAIG